MSGPPRSCRWCANMTCGDVNWCGALKVSVTDSQLPRVRNCPSWEGHVMAADSFEVRSMTEAAEIIGCTASAISNALRSGRTTVKGHEVRRVGGDV